MLLPRFVKYTALAWPAAKVPATRLKPAAWPSGIDTLMMHEAFAPGDRHNTI